MKQKCKKCHKDKFESEFELSRKKYVSKICKECRSNILKLDYVKNKEKYQKRSRNYWIKNRNLIIDLKNKDCSICNKKFHYSVMDFDHIDPSKKIKPISQLKMAGEKKILEEVEKCRLVCANCHRDITQDNLKNVPKPSPITKLVKYTPIRDYTPMAKEEKKKCTKCGIEQSLKGFSFQKIKNRYKAICKNCNNAYNRKYREENKEKNKKYRKKILNEMSLWLNSIKNNKKCHDCDLKHPYWRLDYDHLDNFKKFKPVSWMKQKGYSKERILKEISKCDLVCANCHRKRTWERMENS